MKKAKAIVAAPPPRPLPLATVDPPPVADPPPLPKPETIYVQTVAAPAIVGFWANFKDLLSDDHGHWDIGYVSMFVLMFLILGVIPLMCGGMVIKFFSEPGHPWDILQLGKAVALITGAFTGPLAALAGYVVAMKQRTQSPPPVVTTP